MSIIGFVGFIGSGKDTAADYLCNFHGYRRESFANTLKDAISAVFGWDRILLEGKTKESREWREQVDQWWADRLNMPHLTPRFIMQNWGTNVLREHFHDDIWIASLENKLRKTKDNIVISDVRFPNELTAIKNANGLIVWIKRSPIPDWYSMAIKANKGDENAYRYMMNNVHPSEWAWIGQQFDFIIENDGPINELYDGLHRILTGSFLNVKDLLSIDVL